jgi:hypothetical protein
MSRSAAQAKYIKQGLNNVRLQVTPCLCAIQPELRGGAVSLHQDRLLQPSQRAIVIGHAFGCRQEAVPQKLKGWLHSYLIGKQTAISEALLQEDVSLVEPFRDHAHLKSPIDPTSGYEGNKSVCEKPAKAVTQKLNFTTKSTLVEYVS